MPLARLSRQDDGGLAAVIAHVEANIATDMATGCDVWQGKVLERRYGDPEKVLLWPVIGLPNRQSEHVRRFWWAHNHPEENEDTMRGYRVRLNPEGTCNPLCVNPDHMLVEPAPGYGA